MTFAKQAQNIGVAKHTENKNTWKNKRHQKNPRNNSTGGWQDGEWQQMAGQTNPLVGA
jgi:hypothetical protein